MDEINLRDLDFDFEDYFKRHADGELAEEEAQEFTARVIGLFCRDFFNSKGDASAVPSWTLNHLAEQMYKVLGGEPWDDALPMPWSKRTSTIEKRTDERAIDIFCAVTNALTANLNLAVTDQIQQQADKHCVSFETARADYYRVKLAFDNGVGFRPFLKRD